MTSKSRFEELDFQTTELGDLSLRRRVLPEVANREVYEVILGDAFLMSSLFTTVEIALAKLALAAIDGSNLDVVVGGLGLGYTAQAVLGDQRVQSLSVVEFLEPVIKWHQNGMVPLGNTLTNDSRCRFVHGDFFQRAANGFAPELPDKKFHAILLDIDHSPKSLLHQQNRAFYTTAGLSALAHQLHLGGIFGLWSDEPPDDQFMEVISQVFETVSSVVVPFYNPHQDRDTASTVYLAKRAVAL